MNKPKHLTSAVAAVILIFANLSFLNAQTELPAGTKLLVRMENGISSESAGVNDTFTAVTVKPLLINGVSMVPAETAIVGHVKEVRPAGMGGKPGKLTVEFDVMTFPGGIERRISAVLVEGLGAEKNGTFTALAILGGTAIGGLIGLVSNIENGAVIGAGIGAGAGTGIALSRKGKNVGIKSNEEFEIELTKAVKLPADGY